MPATVPPAMGGATSSRTTPAANSSAIPINPRTSATISTEPEDRILIDSTDAEALLADKARRQKIEEDLRRMGMSPVEIQKLLNAQSRSFDPTPEERQQSTKPVPSPSLPTTPQPTAPPANSLFGAGPVSKASKAAAASRSSLQSMQSFAADLMAQKAAAQQQKIQEFSLDLPQFRESSRDEIRQSETLLRDAAMLRRKENFKAAEEKVRMAIQLVPKDAAALELLGDILQGVARTDEALAAYKRALEADPKRNSSERKYGELLFLQQKWDTTDTEAMRGSSRLATMLSLLLPGLGQFHNRDWAKGITFLCLDLLCFYLLAYSPWGFGNHSRHGIGIGLIVSLALTVVIYIVALVDTIRTPQQSNDHKGRGWNI